MILSLLIHKCEIFNFSFPISAFNVTQSILNNEIYKVTTFEIVVFLISIKFVTSNNTYGQ
jgi:hypothetical protein